MLSYRTILKQAWKISLKNKILWFFGFFASLLSFTAEFKVISKTLNQESGLKSLNNFKMFMDTGIFSKNSLQNFFELLKTDTASILLILIILITVLFISLFFAWLATVSQISIIRSVKNILKGKREKIFIKKSINDSNKRFWPIFFINILTTIIINGIYLLISFLFILVIMKNQLSTSLLYGFIFILFIPISLFLSFIAKYAIAYSVIENKKFINSIKQAWNLFIKNWLISIEMAIILFFINLFIIIGASIISVIGFFLFFSLAISTVFLTSSSFLFWGIMIIGVIVIMAVLILISSFLNVFQISTWTDLFVQLRDKSGLLSSKLEKIFQK